jgi:flagellar basal-body rod protein FlgC
MGMFDAIGIASTGLTVHRKWLDAISDNIANVNTVKPMSGPAFQARYIDVQEGQGVSGVYVKGAAFGSAAGRVTYDPSNPEADKNGYVRMPDIDLATQMTDLIMAQRGYQANAAVVDRAKDSYQAALEIGRN